MSKPYSVIHSSLFDDFALLSPGDKLVGEASRLVVAEACIQALDIDLTEGETYEINSVLVIISNYCKYLCS